MWNASDVVGGYRAWKEAGLPDKIAVDGGAGSGSCGVCWMFLLRTDVSH